MRARTRKVCAAQLVYSARMLSLTHIELATSSRTCGRLHVARRLLHAARRLLHVARRLLHVARRLLHVARHPLHVARRLLHVARRNMWPKRAFSSVRVSSWSASPNCAATAWLHGAHAGHHDPVLSTQSTDIPGCTAATCPRRSRARHLLASPTTSLSAACMPSLPKSKHERARFTFRGCACDHR